MNYERLGKIVLVSLFLLFIIFGSIRTRQAENNFYLSEFSGLIMDIRLTENEKRRPEVMLDSNWINLGLYAGKLREFIEIGDSISKSKKSDSIFLYKKEINGWHLYKIF